MADIKEKYGLDIPVPKPPASSSGKGKEKIKIGVPKGYKASQRSGAYKRKSLRQSAKKRRRRKANAIIPAVYSKIYDEHKQKLLDLIADFLGKELGVIVEWLRDMTNVKRKIRKTLFSHSLMTAGLAVFLIGIALYLECLCPQMYCGLAYLIVGLIAIIASIIYKRYY